MKARMTHECANRCGTYVGVSRLMCRRCWLMVPKPLRDAVTDAWNPRSGIRQTPEYHAAVAAARQALKDRGEEGP